MSGVTLLNPNRCSITKVSYQLNGIVIKSLARNRTPKNQRFQYFARYKSTQVLIEPAETTEGVHQKHDNKAECVKGGYAEL